MTAIMNLEYSIHHRAIGPGSSYRTLYRLKIMHLKVLLGVDDVSIPKISNRGEAG